MIGNAPDFLDPDRPPRFRRWSMAAAMSATSRSIAAWRSRSPMPKRAASPRSPTTTRIIDLIHVFRMRLALGTHNRRDDRAARGPLRVQSLSLLSRHRTPDQAPVLLGDTGSRRTSSRARHRRRPERSRRRSSLVPSLRLLSVGEWDYTSGWDFIDRRTVCHAALHPRRCRECDARGTAVVSIRWG
jgi:hypothetical protein